MILGRVRARRGRRARRCRRRRSSGPGCPLHAVRSLPEPKQTIRAVQRPEATSPNRAELVGARDKRGMEFKARFSRLSERCVEGFPFLRYYPVGDQLGGGRKRARVSDGFIRRPDMEPQLRVPFECRHAQNIRPEVPLGCALTGRPSALESRARRVTQVLTQRLQRGALR
jgi:hypothetical protein